jgi:TRAP-type C4-dicarboxylate transport system permease small subunit
MKQDGLLKRSELFSSTLAYLGAVSLFIMMCLTVADVLGRYVFNKPITGTFELTELMVLILIFSFLANAQANKAHVTVDLILSRFPKTFRVYIELFNHIMSLALMILITWIGALRALELKEVAEASPNLGIPTYPFAFFLVLGCIVMCIEYIRDLICAVQREKGDNVK